MEIAGDQRCAVILDVYLIHRTDVVMGASEECDIELLFMPVDGTSEYQPLDYCILGELKQRAKAEIINHLIVRVAMNIDYDQSICILIRCGNAISGENIHKAWELPGLSRAAMGE
jgi:hypothetical protein